MQNKHQTPSRRNLGHVRAHFRHHLDVIQHELLLRIVHGAVRTFEDRHFLTGKVLVKVCVEQNLLGEDCITHGAFVDQPTKKVEKSDHYVNNTTLRAMPSQENNQVWRKVTIPTMTLIIYCILFIYLFFTRLWLHLMFWNICEISYIILLVFHSPVCLLSLSKSIRKKK